MDLQTLAIFLLATFCAGGIAWVVVYPYLSGEKEAERRMAGIAKSSVPTGKGISRALKSRANRSKPASSNSRSGPRNRNLCRCRSASANRACH